MLVREGRVFLCSSPGGRGLPGGIFRPLAEDRKVELKAHLFDQLGIEARSVWAQGAFDYRHPGESEPAFSGFYSVWEWDGTISSALGEWLDPDGVAAAPELPASLRVLLLSVLETVALRTT